MNIPVALSRILLATCMGSVLMLYRSVGENKTLPVQLRQLSGHQPSETEEENEEDAEEKAKHSRKRWLHELKMLRNPITGEIPADYREVELAAAARIPERKKVYDPFLSRGTGTTANNNYQSLGPANIAGRSRTLAFDRRNPSIMLTGGVTGGIFRSTDGGANWTFVLNENEIRSATSIVQDPTNQNTWYCGTGEVFYPVSLADVSSPGTFGFGIFKSTDNGVTWAKLPATVVGNNESLLDNPFDLVHRLAVHPNGTVYAAVHRRIYRSANGGQSWEEVLGSAVASTATAGITDLIINGAGTKIFAAFTGENPDRNLAGVWESTTGSANSWTRIAGGPAGAADSIAGWRPYQPNNGGWGRVVLALNGTSTQLYVLYKNGLSAEGSNPQPEADLYRANISSGSPATYTWNNLNPWVPDEPNYNQPGIDPYTTQFNGYNMSLNLKPDNDNIMFIGGTNLHRVHLNETDPARKFRRIGGYGVGFFPKTTNFGMYPNHHPDVHGIYFAPNNTDQLFTASDGGIHKTSTSVLADTVRWTPQNKGFQSVQYQFINIYPDTDADWVIGGTQDNGTLTNVNDPTEHIFWQGGDGAAAAFSNFIKNGNTWKQSWYYSIVQGRIFRSNFTFNVANNSINVTDQDEDEITPSGLSGQGQWLTLFVNDPDSSEHLYYNNQNRLFRTTTASSVTATTWTEMTGVANVVPANDNFSAMDISRLHKGTKYLFFGTDGGKVYRLDNAPTAAATSTPRDITPSTMTPNSYVAGVSVNPRNADTVLVVVSNYDAGGAVINNIFWTGNATATTPTWQVIDGALAPVSSQSCEIVARTTGVEYYVGTSVGLYSATAINGNSTQWLNEGGGMMKRAIIRSLSNRYKDNTMAVGTHGNGAFITEIGSAVPTGINDPVVNDKQFIRAVYPTITTNSIQYEIGNLFTIKRINVQLYSTIGQLVYSSQSNYQSGTVDISKLSKGSYILNITSEDGRYRHRQKIIKP